MLGAIVIAAGIGELLEPRDTPRTDEIPPPPAVVAKKPVAAPGPGALEALPVEMQGATPSGSRKAGELQITSESYIGCAARDDYEYLTSLAAQHDMDAFRQAYAAAIVTARCVKLQRGAVVYLEDTALFSGMIQVRPKGKLATYWTAAEAAK